MHTGRLAFGAALVFTLPALWSQGAETGSYRSPYTVKFSYPTQELVGDLSGGRGNPLDESSIPARDWYDRAVKKRWGVWGPPARHYPAPAGIADKSVKWKRERVVAVALRYVGYGYQHHHVPDWNPPRDWPWKETAVGHNGKGLDCSNFSSFVYNQGFGIKPSSAIRTQAESRRILGPEGRELEVQVIDKPASYAELVKTLRTGDLLYIRNRAGELAHVVIWVGPIGQSADHTPLIIDSHGEGLKDSNGANIPVGIHLRPFREKSWYYKSFAHAHRIFRD